MATDDLLVDDAGPVAVFSFNRPASRNALTPAMLAALADGIRGCAARDDLRAVVVRGAPGMPFSAGYDVDALPDRPLDVAAARAIHAPVRAVADAMLACPHPVIGAARKFVYGAALDLFCHCDLRLCAEGTTFSMPPNRYGFLYPDAGIHRMVDVAGMSRATELFLLAQPMPAETALACGLVQRRSTDEGFERDVAALCAAVAANAPLSMRGTKAALLRPRQDGGAPDAAAVERMYAAITACLNSADVREGRDAFREKRPPRFAGR